MQENLRYKQEVIKGGGNPKRRLPHEKKDSVINILD
jgi:hypothetical protein